MTCARVGLAGPPGEEAATVTVGREAAVMPASDPMLMAHERLRLAMFSPVPPTRSGIASYLVDLLPLLPDTWTIDVFTDEGVIVDPDRLSLVRGAPVGCYPHPTFVTRHARAAYDLNVYQVGNSSARTWMLDYVLTCPGLLVLHDGVLHPARVAAARGAADLHGYRQMVRACREDVGNAIGHLVAAGLGGPALYFAYPMCEDLVQASRAAAMHGSASCDWLRRQVPDAKVVELAHWRSVRVERSRRDDWRGRLVGEGEVLIGSFGNIGPERRLERVLRALAEVGNDPPWRLVVAGRVDARLGLPGLAAELGVGDRVTWLEDLDDQDFVAVMAATDVAVNLRYPPARASSGVLHQLLRLGVPALISDVVHWRDYPDDVVARVPAGPDEAEHAELCAALRLWIHEPAARAAAGVAAAGWAARHITARAMRRSYLEAVAACL